MARIAYLGPEGTFTEAALLQMTATGLIPEGPDGVLRLPIESTPAALDAVRDGVADYACVPIENSIDGSVMPTLDGLANGSPLQVFAETTLDVSFSIVVKPGLSCRRGTHGGGVPGGGAHRCGDGSAATCRARNCGRRTPTPTRRSRWPTARSTPP